MMTPMRMLSLFLAAVVLLPVVVGAQTVSQPSAAHSDFSGFWELRFDSRNIPAASLTPWAEGIDKNTLTQRDLYVIRWCNHLGLPAMMDDGAPLDIRQGRYELAVASQSVSPGRHIYLDGRSQPSLDTFDPTTLGNSIGHWEGDSLVVETIGFNDKGITDIPGGGIRTPDSHLTEVYRLQDQGTKLEVTFTWTDPKVYTSPHTYRFLYQKASPGTRAHEWFCDPADNARARFLLDPPQGRP
jgi:hypothetical protein